MKKVLLIFVFSVLLISIAFANSTLSVSTDSTLPNISIGGSVNPKDEAVNWNAIAAIGQVLGSIAAAYAAFIALKTSENAREAYLRSQRPYLAFVDMWPNITQLAGGKANITMNFKFKNVGKVLAIFVFRNFKLVINGVHIDPNFQKKNNPVYPGQEHTIAHAVFNNIDTSNGINGYVEYELKYHTLPEKIHCISMKRLEFTISMTDQKARWVYIDEDEFEDNPVTLK